MPFFSCCGGKEERCFDKLTTNGMKATKDACYPASARSIASQCTMSP